jgi:hypothetical protein
VPVSSALKLKHMNLQHRQESAERLLADPRSYPGLVSRSDAFIILRVWISPAFDPYCSWSVLMQKGKYFLRRVVWDQRKLEVTSEPATFAAEVALKEEDWKPLVTELEQIELPAFVPVNTIGIDGVTYGVEVGGFMTSASFRWWCDPPERWKGLSMWHRKAMHELQKQLPPSTVSLSDEL